MEPDSLFLEITPPDFEDDIRQEHTKDSPEQGNHKASAGLAVDMDKIPYDISISSEADVTNEQDTPDPLQLIPPDDDGSKQPSDNEGSLHDSMEILEEVATEDHFEGQEEDGSDQDDNVEMDIFEMPPMATVVLTPTGEDQFIDLAAAGKEEDEPELVDAQQAIHRLREHTHSPHCRPPESNLEDEFIL